MGQQTSAVTTEAACLKKKQQQAGILQTKTKCYSTCSAVTYSSCILKEHHITQKVPGLRKLNEFHLPA